VSAQGFCNETGLADFLSPDSVGPWTIDTNKTLTFWACKPLPTGEQDPAYYIYLRGRGVIYEEDIGNISCTVFPQPAIFPVLYHSSTDAFSTQEPIITSAHANTFSLFIEHAIITLAIGIQQAQTPSVNLVADSVGSFGLQAMGVGPYNQHTAYLPLYEAIIQGVLVDEVCAVSDSLRH
jgi:hypothetical protein